MGQKPPFRWIYLHCRAEMTRCAACNNFVWFRSGQNRVLAAIRQGEFIKRNFGKWGKINKSFAWFGNALIPSSLQFWMRISCEDFTRRVYKIFYFRFIFIFFFIVLVAWDSTDQAINGAATAWSFNYIKKQIWILANNVESALILGQLFDLIL